MGLRELHQQIHIEIVPLPATKENHLCSMKLECYLQNDLQDTHVVRL